jgi:hypothetical protein
MIFSELTLAIYNPPTGEEQVVQEEVYNEVRAYLGGVSQSTLWCQGIIFGSLYCYHLFL